MTTTNDTPAQWFVRFRAAGRRKPFVAKGSINGLKLKVRPATGADDHWRYATISSIRPVDACLRHPEARLFYEGYVEAIDPDDVASAINLYFENAVVLRIARA